jgi:6,7-dimethyl-8-ribityllumazine synthase
MKRLKTRATPKPGPKSARIAIVRARWNEEITLALERGAILRAAAAGATVDLFEVPGSFELPGAVALLADI